MKIKQDLYGMFKENHPVGSFSLTDISRFTPVDRDFAELVLEWAIDNGRVKLVNGYETRYCHIED